MMEDDVTLTPRDTWKMDLMVLGMWTRIQDHLLFHEWKTPWFPKEVALSHWVVFKKALKEAQRRIIGHESWEVFSKKHP